MGWWNIDPALLQGEYFCVREDLAASRTLVVPKGLHLDPTPQTLQAGSIYRERNGIIILGISYEYVGNDTGFTLDSFDGEGPSLTVWSSKAPAVAGSLVSKHMSDICIPLEPGGGSTSTSPAANGDSLRLTLVGAPVGFIMVWGIHGSLSSYFPSKSYTGSPVTF